MNLPARTLVESVYAHAQTDPEHVAFVTNEGSVSYREFAARITAASEHLVANHVSKGDRVLLVSPNHEDLAVAYFAAHRIGAVSVPIEPSLMREEFEFIVDDAAPKLALVDEHRELPVPTELLRSFTRANHVESGKLESIDPTDNADILYTTGTTGRKKGVLLTHRNISAAALNISTFIGNQKSDLELLPIPLTHSFGLGRLRCMAHVGSSLALQPGIGNPAMLLKRMLTLRASGLALVPAGFELIVGLTKDKLAEAREHLRYVEIGSAPMREETKQRLRELLPNTKICHHYGSTEASRSCFFDFHLDSHKKASVGRASPNVEISILDSQDQPATIGEPGSIVVRGAMTMKGYWNHPEKDADRYCAYGLKTDDIGYCDEEGYVYLLGRQSDIINVGGLKVSPIEIENVVENHELVHDSACIAAPDPITGEKIKLCYVSDAEIEPTEFVKWLRDHLEEYKIPKAFEKVDSIPRTESGKKQRNLLQKIA